jgi:hypothetical protein
MTLLRGGRDQELQRVRGADLRALHGSAVQVDSIKPRGESAYGFSA